MFVEPGDLTDDAIEADIVIFGTGAAGISIAAALDDGRRRIVLVEAGGMETDPAQQALLWTEAIGHPVDTIGSRVRAYGGTTEQWTGRVAPLDPIDFEPRAWVPHSGWPIAYAALAEPYRQAMAMTGFAPGWEAQPEALSAIEALADRPAELLPFTWRFWATSRETFQHWGEAFDARFRRSSTVRVVLGAALVGLDGAGAVAAARCRMADGRTLRIRADRFVLACGGIENCRLMLNIADDTPALLANVRPALGRYFMQHPRTEIASATLDPALSARMQRLFNYFKRPRGLHFETGIALSDTAQRREELLNASAVWRYQRASGGGFDAASLATEGVRALTSLARRARRREPLHGAVEARLVLDLEQEPDPESRILLSRERDATGLRIATIDWRIGDRERRTAARFAELICGWHCRIGLGDPRRVAGAGDDGGLRSDLMRDSYHHLGGTRMSSDPVQGVVDRDLRVHGVDNLFICGGSVFPTGGHANPTLTIVALALRLASTLR